MFFIHPACFRSWNALVLKWLDSEFFGLRRQIKGIIKKSQKSSKPTGFRPLKPPSIQLSIWFIHPPSGSSSNRLAMKRRDSQYIDMDKKSPTFTIKLRTASASDTLWSLKLLCSYLGMSLILCLSGSSWNCPAPLSSVPQVPHCHGHASDFFLFADFDIIFRIHYVHGTFVSAGIGLWGVGCSVG